MSHPNPPQGGWQQPPPQQAPYPPAPPQQAPPQGGWQPPYDGQQPGPQQWQQPGGQPQAPQQNWQQPPPQQNWQQPGPYPQMPQQGGWQQPGPQQGWQQPPGPPQPPMPRATMADYFDDPATGEGQSIGTFFKNGSQPIFGQSLTFQVARPLGDGDIQIQTIKGTNQVATFRDGRPKKVLIIPVTFQPNAKFTDGRGTWWVRGQARDELARAMADAGVPADENGHRVPESGAQITLTLMGTRPVQGGFNDANIWQVMYYRPAGAANGHAPAPQAAQQQAPQGYQPQPYATAPPGQALPQAAAPEMAQMAQQQGGQFAQAGAPVGPGAPQGYQPQPQFAQQGPPAPAPPGPPQQQFGMQAPGAQVAAATQAGVAAAGQYQQPGQPGPQPGQPGQQMQVPPGVPADRMGLLATLAGPQAAQAAAAQVPQQ